MINGYQPLCDVCQFRGDFTSTAEDHHKCIYLNIVFPLSGYCSFHTHICKDGHKFKQDRKSDSCTCTVCGEGGGWYCPDSPDHQCKYSEDEDYCDFCGNPEERK